MSRRPAFERLARASWRLLRLLAVVGLVMPLALVAYAAMTANPPSGEAEPGDTVTATIHVVPTLLAVCLVGVSDDPVNITVAFNPACGGGGGLLGGDPWDSVMTVTVGAQTAPGDYTITITSLDPGSLIYQWPLTVTGPATTTTTTTTPTTTSTSSTTTTTSVTTTTTSGNTPTTTSATTTTMSGNTPTTTSAETPTTTSPAGATSTTSQGDDPAVVLPGGGPSDPGSGAGVDVVRPVSATAPKDGSEVVAAGEDESVFSEVALSSGLIERMSGAVPTVVAEAVLSPLVVAEILFRALGRTMTGLLLPLGLTLLLGLLLFWRLRLRDEDWESEELLDDASDLPEGAT